MYSRLKRGSIVLVLSILLPLGMSLPAYASRGSDDIVSSTGTSGSHDSTVVTSTSSTTEHTTTSDTTTTDTEKPETEAEKQQSEELKKEAETENEKHSAEVLSEAKKNAKEHTKEERQKNCAANQKGIDMKLSNLQKNAKKHLALMDKVLAKVKASSSTAPNFDALVAVAESAKLNATASVSALNELSSTIDCTKDTTASEIAMFKAAADQAKTELKAYRTALKAILSAIETKEGE